MKSPLRPSSNAIQLLKSFEGFRPVAARLKDGRWTIGYGHTKSAREGIIINESDAEALLIYDLLSVAEVLNTHIYTPLCQNQFDALSCFTFNVGADNFRASDVLRLINEGNMLSAAYALEAWRKADFEGSPIVVDALVRRRAAEKVLFLTPRVGWVPVPTPVLPPLQDRSGTVFCLRDKAVDLVAPLQGESAVFRADAPPATELVLTSTPAIEEIPESDVEVIEDQEPPESIAAPVETDQQHLPLSEDDIPFVEAPQAISERYTPEASEALLYSQPFTMGDMKNKRFGVLPLVMLFLLGLMIFIFAIVWGIQTHSGSGGPMWPQALSWGSGVAGVLAMVGAYYKLAGLLGADDE